MADNFDDEVALESPQPARRRVAQDFDDEGDDNGQDAGPPQPPQARAPMKGWGDSGSSAVQQTAPVVVESGVSENINGEDPAPGPTPTAFGRRAARPPAAHKDKYDSDVITDITEIPDVEEEAREGDLTTTVADAPNVRSNRVQALQELDQQILFQLPSAMGDGIDLSLLTSALSPQENVSELDQLWEFDQLFADVSSEMLAEMEPTEKEEGEEEEDDENAGVARGDGKKAHTLRNRGNKAVEVEA